MQLGPLEAYFGETPKGALAPDLNKNAPEWLRRLWYVPVPEERNQINPGAKFIVLGLCAAGPGERPAWKVIARPEHPRVRGQRGGQKE